MRSIALLLPAFAAFTATAQTDVDKKVQERMAQRPGAPGSTNGVRIEDDNDPFVPNTFIGSFTMNIQRFANGAEDMNVPRVMRFWSSADKTVNEMEAPRADLKGFRTLTDLRNKWTYLLTTDGEGHKHAMKARKQKVISPADAGAKPEVTVTKETRTIDGHRCTKVIAKSAEGVWTGWVAQDVPMPFGDVMRSMGGNAMSADLKGIDGFALEYEWVANNGQDRVVVHVSDLRVGSVDEGVFDLSRYEVMESPAMNFGH